MNRTIPNPSPPFRLARALTNIIDDAIYRVNRVSSRVAIIKSLLPFRIIPQVTALALARRDSANKTDAIIDTDNVFYSFDFFQWRDRAEKIRLNALGYQCLVALSEELSRNSGPLVMAEATGTSGVLSLLPTAGALIGSPAKESWLVYKLMPAAGVLSMLLSLGGNIVPRQANEYIISTDSFDYGGLIATTRSKYTPYEFDDSPITSGTEAQKFAARVRRRANRETGTSGLFNIVIAMLMQCFWLAILIGACWFTGIGSIIPWWCGGTYWMLFWYLCVVLSSMTENITSVPFTRQWTIRISKALVSVEISPDAPRVAWTDHERSSDGSKIQAIATGNAHDHMSCDRSLSNSTNAEVKPRVYSQIVEGLNTDDQFIPLNASRRNTRILDNLKNGYNTTGRVVLDSRRPYSASQTPFYVIVSLEGMSQVHVFLRIISKIFSVVVFTMGTFLFATTTLITITVGVVVMSLVLSAGIFGRVLTMWTASELMRHEPVLHKIVKRKDEAAEYVNEVLATPGIVCEVSGHIIVNGHCVARYRKWFTKAHYFGILAKPYDITKLSL